MSDVAHKNVEDELAELLKRCSPDTLKAALSFRKTKDVKQIETIVLGVIDRHLEPEQREIFKDADDSFRLYEDLGLDSLTMLEIVMLVEQTLQISIDNEELRDLRTIGDVKQYLDAKVRGIDMPDRSKTYRIEEVASLMPHREPFLFLQDVTIEGDQARGDYRITGNEYFLQGHFKDQPVFPASIMIGEEGGDMIGINPYYIPPRVRVKVIDFFLNNLTTNRNIDANDRTVVIYQKIKNTALGEAMKPAIKRYIKSRISSRVVRLSPRLWIDMYLGQTSSKMNKLFRGASVSEVYRDYRVKFLRNY